MRNWLARLGAAEPADVEARIAQALEAARAEWRADLAAAAHRTTGPGHPNLTPLHVALRDHALLAGNLKVFGTELAERLWAEAPARDAPAEPVRVGLTGRLCRQADIESAWLRHWAAQCRMTPIYHRKVWEIAYILQAIWESGLLRAEAEALGFAVGQEPIPAVLAVRGVRVLATDLQPGDPRAQVWRETSQNAAELRALHRPALLPEAEFRARCGFRHLDMTAIPPDLHGRFDILWSGCALEHLASIAAGLGFIEQAMACLRPGGIAVHTTEFNLAPGEETIDNWPTVLFRQADLQACVARLTAAGHTVLPVDFARGEGVLDGYVDLPPFQPIDIFGPKRRHAPHLNLSIDGFPATSVGLIIRAGG